MEIDGYRQFFEEFGINKIKLFEWGINKTVFPSVDFAKAEWERLKNKIYNNEVVYIRGYGRDAKGTFLYFGFYEMLLGNTKVKKDGTNNYIPQRLVERATGYKRNRDIFNYQVSHIWGKTKNVFLFEAPWNVCLTPKIMDPFTGHETKGEWPVEYQKLLLEKAYGLYGKLVDDYNALIGQYDMEDEIKRYMALGREIGLDEKVLTQFAKDAPGELSVIS